MSAGEWTLATAASAVLLSGLLLGACSLLASALPGRLGSTAALFSQLISFCRTLLVHPEVPWKARLILASGLLYALSPVTLIPDFVPILGKADNLLAIVIACRFSARLVPASVIEGAWPGSPAALRWLIGSGRLRGGKVHGGTRRQTSARVGSIRRFAVRAGQSIAEVTR